MGIPSLVFTVYCCPERTGGIILTAFWCSYFINDDNLPCIFLKNKHTRERERERDRDFLTCSLTDARMAEVVSDSEPSPLEALRTGLNMVAAQAVLDATSGTGIPPEREEGKMI